MKPTYEIKAWQEADWWLARVVGASDGADASPLNGLTQSRTLVQVEPMARDLVATILDTEQSAFDVTVDYVLPEDAGDLVRQAKAARAWAGAARELSQDRSAVAARALTDRGYSLRETAALLGISHQRVDQLLGSVMERAFAESLADHLARTGPVSVRGVNVLFMVHRSTGQAGERPYLAEMDRQFREEAGAALLAWESRIAHRDPGENEPGGRAREAAAAGSAVAAVIRHGWTILEA